MPNLHKLFSVVFFVLFSVLTAQIMSDDTGNWDNTDTWDGGVVPTQNDNVFILSGHTVTVQGSPTAEMMDLTINSGGILNANVFFSTLDVYGNWTNNGTFTTGGWNTVTFKGNQNQLVKPGGDEFNDIVLSNTGTLAKTIAIFSNIDINNNLTFTMGILDLDTNDPAISIGGNVTISNGAVWTKGLGTVTFDGGTQNYNDQNASPNNIGNVTVNEQE